MIPIKIPMTFFPDQHKVMQKFIWKHKSFQTAKNKKLKTCSPTLPNFKIYYRADTIKTAWFWHKNRDTDQWNRTEIAENQKHE